MDEFDSHREKCLNEKFKQDVGFNSEVYENKECEKYLRVLEYQARHKTIKIDCLEKIVQGCKKKKWIIQGTFDDADVTKKNRVYR